MARVTSKKAVAKSGGRGGKGRLTVLDARRLRQLLPRFYQHTQGKSFKPQALRAWLGRLPAAGKSWKVPAAATTLKLLQETARAKSTGGHSHKHKHDGVHHTGGLGVWKSNGVRYHDPEGDASVQNIKGFEQKRGRASGTRAVSWHEHGYVFRLRAVSGEKKTGPQFEVTRSNAFKRLGSVVTEKDLEVTVDGRKSTFKRSIVMDPRHGGVGSRAEPEWTLIYLHSFSNKGRDYTHFPHYFGVGGSNIRVVIPTAPQLEQSCFPDWNVWKGWKLGWRPIKFYAWFDYLTDKAGAAENHINLESLLEMRARLHKLIDAEVKRVGDPKKVLLGGASQGCCVALDAALTYPEELGGVVGLVGHHLSCTPLCPKKRSMPLYLFHEATDKEMRWRWVKDTVQRLQDEGFNVISKREADPAGCGHWIQEIEGQWIRSALRRIVLGAGSS